MESVPDASNSDGGRKIANISKSNEAIGANSSYRQSISIKQIRRGHLLVCFSKILVNRCITSFPCTIQ